MLKKKKETTAQTGPAPAALTDTHGLIPVYQDHESQHISLLVLVL